MPHVFTPLPRPISSFAKFSGSRPQSRPVRLGSWRMTACSIILLAQLPVTGLLHAQTFGGSSQYPYCAQFSDGTSLDCGFSSLQMCEQSVTGVGGVCILNPSGPPASGSQNQAADNLPAPPPIETSGPLQLPDTSSSPPSPPCDPLIDGTYCASAAGNPVNATQSAAGIASMQSLSSDLAIGGNPPATLGAINFSGDGSTCIGLFRRMSCGS
jgi:hypothetical protein